VINILGIPISLPVGLEYLSEPGWAFLINMVAWVIVAVLLNFILLRLFKFITRQLPGELEDIILGILRRPILILFGLYGVNFSIHQLPLQPDTFNWIEILSFSAVVLIITNISSRFIKDILVYYGERWAARSETRIDDVLIPVLNLFGPLILTIIAALVILPRWGINITSVLLGAGVLGLVLGLALQETLGNIFSGLSLLIEGPFRKGDLVLLPDGRVSEVQHLGMRSTMLFSLTEQATIYMPNKVLASSMLINMTMPTPEQRYCIDLTINNQSVNLAQIQHMLLHIANGHPAIISSNMVNKLEHVKSQTEKIRAQAERLGLETPVGQSMLAEAQNNEQTLAKLELEGAFNAQVIAFKEALRNLIRGINVREANGMNESERQEIIHKFITPADEAMEAIGQKARAWYEARDAWLNSTDYWTQRKLWEARTEQLSLHWNRLKQSIYRPEESRETRLDDSTKLMLEWLEKEYKVPPGYWKNPAIAVKDLSADFIHLQLWYYVDNIRLEHDSRPQRARAELSRLIHEAMFENGYWK
jgi:MscS family membrane protein